MTADHSAELEELMALHDGELAAADAERVRAHLAACAECQRFAGDLGGVSARMQQWTVGTAPAALQLPPGRRWFRSRRLLATAAMLILAVGGGSLFLSSSDRVPSTELPAEFNKLGGRGGGAKDSAGPAPQATSAAPLPANMARRLEIAQLPAGPVIIRTASLSIIVLDHEAGRAELERIARSVNGFIGNLVASGARGAAPTLSATLRVPSTRLDEAIAALKRLGTVQHEQQGSDDVTQQSTDLNARLVNARVSEARLSDILKNRTGRLSDVLDVEREIARVRGEIEQMEAERKSMDDRVAYATLQVEMTTERRAEGVVTSMSISTRLRNAVVDGYAAAVERTISLAVFIAEVLPTVVLWVMLIAPAAWLVRRRVLGRV